jgi:hypothetical protein
LSGRESQERRAAATPSVLETFCRWEEKRASAERYVIGKVGFIPPPTIHRHHPSSSIWPGACMHACCHLPGSREFMFPIDRQSQKATTKFMAGCCVVRFSSPMSLSPAHKKAADNTLHKSPPATATRGEEGVVCFAVQHDRHDRHQGNHVAPCSPHPSLSPCAVCEACFIPQRVLSVVVCGIHPPVSLSCSRSPCKCRLARTRPEQRSQSQAPN